MMLALGLLIVIVVGIASGLVGIGGGTWAQHLSGGMLRKAFAVLLAATAVKLYFQ